MSFEHYIVMLQLSMTNMLKIILSLLHILLFYIDNNTTKVFPIQLINSNSYIYHNVIYYLSLNYEGIYIIQ